MGNDKDHTVPASVSKEAAKRLGKSEAVVDYKEWAGRPHFTAGAPGWEEVADYALHWVNRHAGAPAERYEARPLRAGDAPGPGAGDCPRARGTALAVTKYATNRASRPAGSSSG